MKVEIIDKGKKPVEWAKFVVSGISMPIANAMRQAIIAETPVLAIEDVAIRQNSSPLYDEVLALRLGLIPIKTDDSFELGNPGSTAVFTMKKKGPGWVYSGDLVCSEKKISVVFDNIPVTFLDEGQEVDLDATAIMGMAREHVKWQAGFAIVQGYPKVKVLKSGIEYAEGVSAKDALISKDGQVKDLKKWSLGLAKKQIASGAEITEEEDKFIFYVESFGQMPLSEIVARASETAAKKFEEFRGLIKK